MGNGNGVLLRSRMLAQGFHAGEIRQMHGARSLVSLRRGAYAEPDDRRLRRPEDRHELTVRAAVAQLGPDLVISHASAAVLWRIALWAVALDRVHATRPGRSGGRRSRQLHLHRTPLEPDEITSRGGIALTTAARTVADLLRCLPAEQGLVVADNALYRDLVTVDEIAASLDRDPRRHRTAAARRVLAFADRRAESPGESRSRWRMHLAGLPAPDLQVPLWSVDGVPLGRGDFGWDGVVGEFDGRVKYGRLLRPGQDPGEVVFAEKVREDAVRETGTRMTRWIWADLDPFDAVVDRVNRALGRRQS